MKSIEEICEEYGIKNYTINDDGSINVLGDIIICYRGLTKLPLKFNYVSGSFDCSNNKLTTLEGCPNKLGSYFDCNKNDLTSLEFSPKEVNDSFCCAKNKLTSLEFSPRRIGGDLYCYNNEITNLYGISDNIGGDLYCYNNPIGSIFNDVDMDLIIAFNSYKVIKDNTISLKRLKYVMELFEMEYDLEKIKEFYAIN